jgi:hypothetical protein
MLLAHLAVAARKAQPLKMPMLVVALSALAALLFTVLTQPAAAPQPHPAGAAKLRLLDEEHAIAANQVRDMQAAVEAERAVAAHDRAEMRAMAAAGPAQRIAVVAPAPNLAKVASARAVASVPVPAAGPPLQLEAVVPPAKPRRAVAQKVLAAVGRIPQWVRGGVEDAADWAIVGPVKAISRLPERHFL